MLSSKSDFGLILQALMIDHEGEHDFYLDQLQNFGWGRRMIFSGRVMVASEVPIPMQMVLDDCRDLHWQLYTHLQSKWTVHQPTRIISYKAGRDQHRSPMQLLTDHFGARIFYGSLAITRR